MPAAVGLPPSVEGAAWASFASRAGPGAWEAVRAATAVTARAVVRSLLRARPGRRRRARARCRARGKDMAVTPVGCGAYGRCRAYGRSRGRSCGRLSAAEGVDGGDEPASVAVDDVHREQGSGVHALVLPLLLLALRGLPVLVRGGLGSGGADTALVGVDEDPGPVAVDAFDGALGDRRGDQRLLLVGPFADVGEQGVVPADGLLGEQVLRGLVQGAGVGVVVREERLYGLGRLPLDLAGAGEVGQGGVAPRGVVPECLGPRVGPAREAAEEQGQGAEDREGRGRAARTAAGPGGPAVVRPGRLPGRPGRLPGRAWCLPGRRPVRGRLGRRGRTAASPVPDRLSVPGRVPVEAAGRVSRACRRRWRLMWWRVVDIVRVSSSVRRPALYGRGRISRPRCRPRVPGPGRSASSGPRSG